MKPCCESMADAVAKQGLNGFSVYLPDELETDPLKRIPKIVFRSFNKGLENQVEIIAGHNVEVAYEGRMTISYCPWCGCRLEDLDE